MNNNQTNNDTPVGYNPVSKRNKSKAFNADTGRKVFTETVTPTNEQITRAKRAAVIKSTYETL